MSDYPDNQEFSLKKYRPFIILGVVILVLIIFGSKTFVILQPTERGILFRKYTSGLDTERIYQEGMTIVAPWNDMIVFSVQEQQVEETMDILSSDGLNINLDVSLRFRPRQDSIGALYRAFKMDFVTSLIRPELRSVVRRVIGNYTPKEIYSTKRKEIETEIEQETTRILSNNHLELRALLFRSVRLPESLQKKIAEKLAAKEESEKYVYVLLKAEQEAEQRRIDADGKATANKILNASLTSNILKDKGIEATLELAKSPNSKIVIVGNEDGLPLILGND